MNKELMFSVTLKDCDVEVFRAGGKGGQAQNKKSTGVRVRHRASGAVGEGRDSRDQLQNKRNAFVRMSQTKEFQLWHKKECARLTGLEAEIEREVDKQMARRNLKVEVKDDEGNWVISDAS